MLRGLGIVVLLLVPAGAAGQNQPPPVPPLQYPDGTETIHDPQPTIILENVDDPDGDAVQYFIEVDYNACFCSPQWQRSGALPEGDLVTQWQPPHPLPLPFPDLDRCDYFIRRWASDGELESARELSLFELSPCDEAHVEPDGDADA